VNHHLRPHRGLGRYGSSTSISRARRIFLPRTKADLPTVQRAGGHKTLAMLLRYFHAHGDTAIELLGLSLPGTITPELHMAA
jgi:hypothetical protein